MKIELLNTEFRFNIDGKTWIVRWTNNDNPEIKRKWKVTVTGSGLTKTWNSDHYINKSNSIDLIKRVIADNNNI